MSVITLLPVACSEARFSPSVWGSAHVSAPPAIAAALIVAAAPAPAADAAMEEAEAEEETARKTRTAALPEREYLRSGTPCWSCALSACHEGWEREALEKEEIPSPSYPSHRARHEQ